MRDKLSEKRNHGSDDRDGPAERAGADFVPRQPSHAEYQILSQALCEHLEDRFPGRLAAWEKKLVVDTVLSRHPARPSREGLNYLSTLTTAANKAALEIIQGCHLQNLVDGPGALRRADEEFVRYLFNTSAGAVQITKHPSAP